jgi:anti-sigma-K factor RskA
MRFALLAVFVVGCAHDVVVAYPAAPDAPTGTLVLKLSTAASGVSVAIGGLLVVEDAHTGKVVIEHVPVGNTEVTMAANGVDKQFKVWVDDRNPTTVPLGVAEPSLGMVKSIFASLVTIIAYSLLH